MYPIFTNRQNLLNAQTGYNQFEPVCGQYSEFIDLQKAHGPEKFNISMIPDNIDFPYVFRIHVQ